MMIYFLFGGVFLVCIAFGFLVISTTKNPKEFGIK